MFEDQYYYSYYLTELYSSSGIGSFLLNRFTSKSARPSTSTAFYNYTIFENQYNYSYYTIGLDSSLGIGSFLLNRFTSKSARPSTPTVSYTPYYQSRGIGVSNLSKSVRNIYTSVSSNLYNYYSSEQLGIGSFLLDSLGTSNIPQDFYSYSYDYYSSEQLGVGSFLLDYF